MPLSRAVATEGAGSQDKTMISRLAHLPWFAGLPADVLTHIARHGAELSLADQQVLFLKDSPAQYLALVLSGQVYHLLHNQDGRELIIDRSQVGDWVGESALLEGHDRRDCTAVADGATRVWLLPRAQFGPLTGNPEFCAACLRRYADACAPIPSMWKPCVCTNWLHGWRVICCAWWTSSRMRPAYPVYGCIRPSKACWPPWSTSAVPSSMLSCVAGSVMG